ncbi:ParA family protein [Micromonospora aurantiaca (nom. illeg.)]|uniref:ParA family protein n=1 Tax=Micromonospora aurantiaca (nom. illeg.) TaxID=47850 RepID=UPI0033D2D222
MALIALASAKGAPGVTVTSLALTLAWPRAVLLAECDPSGGTIQAGYLAGQLTADRGLAKLAIAERHGRLYDEFGPQLIDLGADARQHHPRWLLPGVSDPAHAANLTPGMWERLGGYLAQLEDTDVAFDVLADCGRVPALNAPLTLMRHAEVVLLLVESTMPAISAARPRVRMLQRELEQHGVGVLRLLVRGHGPYSAREVAEELQAPVLAELPEDERTARMLSLGDGTPRHNANLLRAGRSLQEPLDQLIQGRRAAATGIEEASHATR